MERFKRSWRKTPPQIRRPLVMIVGGVLIIISGSIGWLPGPGGIPLFLLGIAVLASEFTWAERIRDAILEYIHMGARYGRRHPIVASIILLLLLTLTGLLIYASFLR